MSHKLQVFLFLRVAKLFRRSNYSLPIVFNGLPYGVMLDLHLTVQFVLFY